MRARARVASAETKAEAGGSGSLDFPPCVRGCEESDWKSDVESCVSELNGALSVSVMDWDSDVIVTGQGGISVVTPRYNYSR